MNPLQSTALKISAFSDESAAKAASVQPYEDDLKHLLDQAKNGEGAAFLSASTQTIELNEAQSSVPFAPFTLLLGSAFAQKLLIGTLRH